MSCLNFNNTNKKCRYFEIELMFLQKYSKLTSKYEQLIKQHYNDIFMKFKNEEIEKAIHTYHYEISTVFKKEIEPLEKLKNYGIEIYNCRHKNKYIIPERIGSNIDFIDNDKHSSGEAYGILFCEIDNYCPCEYEEDRKAKMTIDGDNLASEEYFNHKERSMKLPANLQKTMATRISVDLYQGIINFLLSLPNIQDSNAQKALLYGAVLDSELHNQISIGNSPIEFVQVVVGSLINYGILNDGRIAIIAILEVSKQFIGHDKRSDCDKLIKAVQTAYNRQERMSC